MSTKNVFLSSTAIHDLNSNGIIDKEDVYAVDMKAPANTDFFSVKNIRIILGSLI